MSSQLELNLSKTRRKARLSSGATVNVRLGKLDPKHLHICDIDRILGPHGDAASDSLERDLAMDEMDAYDALDD